MEKVGLLVVMLETLVLVREKWVIGTASPRMRQHQGYRGCKVEKVVVTCKVEEVVEGAPLMSPHLR